MDAGSPPPSRAAVLARWGRRIAVLAIALVFLPPLLLRGPVVRWVAARASRELCGTLRIDGGHLGWFVVPELLRGRPFSVELRDAHVLDVAGNDVLRAESLSARVDISRHPWRVVVFDAATAHGSWHIKVNPEDRVGGLLGALRKVPAGAPKSVCLEPVERARGPRPPAPANASLEVRDLRIDDVDVDLDFPMWGLTLTRANATGSIAFGTPGGAGFTFDVRNAVAPVGELRIGPPGTRATTTARFDSVVLSHVGVSRDEPSDIVLEVARADTGRSRLSGTASFVNVFARHGRRGDKNPPGLELDARWDHLADAMAQLRAPWLPRDVLGEVLEGALVARMRGAFNALTGTLSIDGPRLGLEASIEQSRRATLDARMTELALTPFLHESLAPLLGGRVTGRLRAVVARGTDGVDLEIPGADVALMRDGPAPTPRELAFRVGAAANSAPARAADDTLALGLTSASLRHRALRLEGLSAKWAELSARGALTLVMPARIGDAPAAPARIDASVTAAVTSLARWIAPEDLSARASARLTLSGPLDHLHARLAFAPSSTATLLGERFRVPSSVTADLDDRRTLTFDGLALERVGGGRLAARGRVERAGPISGDVRLSGYPLAALPGLERVVLPGTLGGKRGSSHEALEGRADAALKVSGSMARPAVSGTLALADVALSGRRIGDGNLRIRARGWALTVDGTLGPSLALDLGATRGRQGFSANANLAIRDLPLSPWLPDSLSGLDVSISGVARVALAPHRPLTTFADLNAVGPGGTLALKATTSGETAKASARGRLELRGLRSLWERGLVDADGALDVDVDAATSPHALLTGTLVVARALSVRPRRWPLAIGVTEGGRLDVDGTRLRITALTLTAPGAWLTVAGNVTADLSAPARTQVDLTANGRLDAATLARQARLPALASASGTVTLDARAKGSLGDAVGSGALRLDGVELRPAAVAWPALRLDGVVEATERGLVTRALRVQTEGAGLASGAVSIGAREAPASVEIGSGWPPRVAHLDVPVVGRGLRVGGSTSSFEIATLDANVRLEGDPSHQLVLSGDVGIAGARFDPFAGKKKKLATGPTRPWFEALPPWLTLDLTVHGPKDAIVVDVPVLPDVGLGLRCHVTGNRRGGTIAGQVRGSGPYSRVLIALFGPKGTRECRFLPQ